MNLKVIEEFLSGDPSKKAAQLERKLEAFRRDMILSLVNSDEELRPFRTQFAPVYDGVSTELINSAKHDLQTLWKMRKTHEKVIAGQKIVDAWLIASYQRPVNRVGMPPVFLPMGTGRVMFSPTNFAAQIALGIVENWRKFHTCINPKCKVEPYYIAKRKEQQVCSEGPCTRYARSEYQAEWWRNHHGKGARRLSVQ